jgi:anti-sigma-K factor RskA
MMLLVGVAFTIIATNSEPHEVDFYLPASMCAVALLLQIGFIIDNRKHWESMGPETRSKRVWQSVWVPPVVGWGSFLALAIVAVVGGIWLYNVVSSGYDSGYQSSLEKYNRR